MSGKKQTLFENWFSFIFGTRTKEKQKPTKEQKEISAHYKHVKPRKKEEETFFI